MRITFIMPAIAKNVRAALKFFHQPHHSPHVSGLTSGVPRAAEKPAFLSFQGKTDALAKAPARMDWA